jgi:hypothetical protein
LGLYLKLSLYRVLVYSRCNLDRFQCKYKWHLRGSCATFWKENPEYQQYDGKLHVILILGYIYMYISFILIWPPLKICLSPTRTFHFSNRSVGRTIFFLSKYPRILTTYQRFRHILIVPWNWSRKSRFYTSVCPTRHSTSHLQQQSFNVAFIRHKSGSCPGLAMDFNNIKL